MSISPFVIDIPIKKALNNRAFRILISVIDLYGL
jgi:hypothetical protein